MRYQFNFEAVWAAMPIFARGLGVTVVLTLVAMVAGVAVGLVVSLARLSRWRWLQTPARLYTEFFRSTPLLVQLLWVYYSVPILTGVALSALASGLIGLTLNLGAFSAEVFRAGIQSIGRGQREAALALGMTWRQSMMRIILPQAIRRVIPPLGSIWVSLFKDTSMVSIISVGELMYNAKLLSVETYRPVEIYTAVALIYFIVTYPQARFVDRLFERYRVRN